MDNNVGADANGEVDDEEEDAPPPVTPEAATPMEGAEPGSVVPETPSPTDPVPGTPAGADPNGELKEVPVTPVAAPAPVHHETLFDDAPDKK
jgi:hypothetical protein